jgi:hypothetical protein
LAKIEKMDQVATAGGAVSGCVWSISRLSAEMPLPFM